MRTQVIAAVLTALHLSALSVASAQEHSVVDKLAGTWNAEPLEIRLNSDFRRPPSGARTPRQSDASR